MTVQVQLRRMQEADLPDVGRLCEASLLHDKFADRLPRLLSDRFHHGIVATIFQTGGHNVHPNSELVIGAVIVSTDRYEGLADVIRSTSPAPGLQDGFIDLVSVAPPYQGQGVGKKLLRAGEAHLVELGCDRLRIIGNPPHYAWAGVDLRYLKAVCMFEAMSYQRVHVALNLSVSLSAVQLDTQADEVELVRTIDLEFRRARPADTDWLRAQLSAHWKRRWVDQVLSGVTGDAPPRAERGVHLAVNGDDLVGFCAWGVNRPNEIGPLGVLPGLRRQGLGGILLRRCCLDQSTIGLAASELQWAGPLGYFSRLLGAQTSRVFLTYMKPADLARRQYYLQAPAVSR